MKITVDIGKCYALRSEMGGVVTNAKTEKPLETLAPNAQIHMTAQEPEWNVPDDCTVTKVVFNFALAALGLLGGGADKLPAGYTRVEFLESTGTQYIDTGILLNSESAVSVRASATKDGGGYLFGSMDVVERRRLLALGNETSQNLFGGYGPYYRYLTVDNALEPREYKFNGGLLSVDGETLANYGEVPYFESTTPCYLFAYNRLAVGVDGRGRSRIWSFKIAGQAHFVPALDPTGTPCMFDLVSKQAFRNAGSGQFIAGMTLSQVRGLRLPAGGGKLTLSLPHEASIDRVAQAALEQARANGWTLTVQYREGELPAGYGKLEFLESTGAQYINTGYVPDNETGIYLYQLKTATGDSVPMGCRNTSSTESRFYALRSMKDSSDFNQGSGFGWGGWVHYPTFRGLSKTYTNYMNERVVAVENSDPIALEVLPFTPECSIYMFAVNIGKVAQHIWGGRIYEAVISQGDSIAMSFVPCISPDGKLGMYNKIDGTLHENVGAGSFVAGLATVDDVLNLWLPETGGPLTVSVPADTPDSAVEQLRSNNPTWQIAIQYRTDNEN